MKTVPEQPDAPDAKSKTPETKPEAKAEAPATKSGSGAQADPKPDAKAESKPKPEAKTDAKPEAKVDTKADAASKPKSDAQSEPKTDAKAEAKPEAKVEKKVDAASKPGSKFGSKPKTDLQTLPLAEVEKQLGFSSDGLSEAEAKKRLAQYGPNEIEEKKINPILKFLSYLWGPIPWMIEVAVILSGAVQHWTDFFIILFLLLANAVVGFWEEHTAGNAIDALKATLAVKARVKRDGKWATPPARELVPGDVIRLRLGDIVPADARLLEGDEISVDQSALTGESLPATRKAGEAVFSGSIIRRGEIGGLVYATGTKTYFGKTAQLVQEAKTASHFQKAVLKIGNYLIVLAVVMVSVIVTVSLIRGNPILTTLLFALVLVVAAIPVALPTVLSVTMAVGARLLAKKQAIVSKLVAIEELAGVDTLCSDKTGTLTQNKLTLGDPFRVDNVSAEQVILDGALASRTENNDTIDLAVIGGLKNKDPLKDYQVTHFQPFDPVHKRTEATVQDKNGKTFKVTKGAPQVILALAANAGQVKATVEKAVNEFAARGFRSLGVARAEGDGQWHFIGVLPLFDPPREDAKATIATAESMGVKVKMVTGDALAIAKETAGKLGMGTNILDAAGLGDSKKDENAQVAEVIAKADGYAQVFPEHKFHIVDVLQKHGHIVGMTGDGVNDAPALKKADCGIAVSGATDAARAAASIVLLTPGLAVIIDAIKESRRIFQRMNSYAIYRIAETLRVLLFITAAILFFNFYPLTAVMIVMLAVLNDGAILSIAYDNVHFKNQPEAWNMKMVLGIATVLGIVGPIAAFGLFFLGDRVFHLDHKLLQPMMYLMLSVAGHMTIFLTRTRGPFWSIRPARILWMAVLGTQIIATFIAVYGFLMPPLGWEWAGFVWVYAAVWALASDRVKILAYRILDPIKAEAKQDVKGERKPEAKPEAKKDAKTDTAAKPKSDAPAEPKPEAKADAETKPATKTEAKEDPKTHTPAKPKSDAVEPKPDPKADTEPKPQAKVEAKPEASSDLTSQIAKRAFELYEQAGRQGNRATQDWLQATRDVQKEAAKASSTPEGKSDPKLDAQTEPSQADKNEVTAVKADSAPESKVEAKPVANAEPMIAANEGTKSDAKAEPKPDAKMPTDLTPLLVKRVHELYEELGRKDLASVQDMEKADRENQKGQSKAEAKPNTKVPVKPDEP